VRLIHELPGSAEVVIIGGGIVGCATAFFLSRSGRQPLLIERADTVASATTAVSAHAIRCQFTEPENIAQTSESLRIYEQFREVIGDPSAQINLTQNGYLFASTDDADNPAFEARVARQHELGIDDVELLTGDEIRYRFPWMSNQIRVGAFRQRDGWIDSIMAANHFL
jgi:glycine/D-amino acid oxidase-like deaminating enzyme